MDITLAVQALEANLRGFCYPAMYLNADRFSTGASDDFITLISQILERCHPSIQAYLSAKGYYTPLTKFTGPEWYRCFESFMRSNVQILDDASSVPILPASSWEKSSFAVAKIKEVTGFVRILKAAVPKKKRTIQAHRPTSSLSQALKTSKVGLEGVELTTPDTCDSKQMLRVAFASAEKSSDSFDDAVESESQQYLQGAGRSVHSRGFARIHERPGDRERANTNTSANRSTNYTEERVNSILDFSRPSSGRHPSAVASLNDYTLGDIFRGVEQAIHAVQVVNAKVDSITGRLDLLEQKLNSIFANL